MSNLNFFSKKKGLAFAILFFMTTAVQVVTAKEENAEKFSKRLLELSDQRSDFNFLWDIRLDKPLFVVKVEDDEDEVEKTPEELLDEAIDRLAYDEVALMDQTLKGKRLIHAVKNAHGGSTVEQQTFYVFVLAKTSDNKAIMTFDDGDAEGLTALHHAVLMNDDYLMYNLLRGPNGVTVPSGASPDSVDLTGKTALHHAAIHGLYFQAHILLALNASTSITDNDGKTAEDRAQDAGNLDIVNKIREKNGEDQLAASFTLVSSAAGLTTDGRYMIRFSNGGNPAGMEKGKGRCLNALPSADRTVADACNPVAGTGSTFTLTRLADSFGTDKYLIESAEQRGECVDSGEHRRSKRFHLALKPCIDVTAANPSKTQIATVTFPAADSTDKSVSISFERDSTTSNVLYMNGNSRNWTVKAGGDNGSQWEILEEGTDADGNAVTTRIAGLNTLNADQSYMIRLKNTSRCLTVLPLIERSVADTCDMADTHQWFTFEQIASLGSSHFLIESAGTLGKCIDSGEFRRKKRFHLSAKTCIDTSANDLGRNQVMKIALPEGDFSGTSFVMSFERDEYDSSTLHLSGNHNTRTVKARNDPNSRWEIFLRGDVN